MTSTTRTKILALAVAAGAGSALPANAQNPLYTPGDLVLAFQNPGGAVGAGETLYVSLGNTALNFRGAAAGTDSPSLLNIININAQLISAFGSNWANEITLYAGLSGVWGTSSLGTGLQNGDPNRTLYVSKARLGIGTFGLANSTGWTITSDTGMTAGANGMVSQNTTFEVNYTTQAAISPTGVSTIDEQNPFDAPGSQGLAFGAFIGGVQQAGTAGSFGSFGGVSDVEFALDLYRILARNNIAGQVGGDVREGSYEGTIVVDNVGNVSYVVPEPSSALLFCAMTAGAVGLVRRRRF